MEKNDIKFSLTLLNIKLLLNKKHIVCFYSRAKNFIIGPSDWSRTSGLLNPIQARYQTAPHPEISQRLLYHSKKCFASHFLKYVNKITNLQKQGFFVNKCE